MRFPTLAVLTLAAALTLPAAAAAQATGPSQPTASAPVTASHAAAAAELLELMQTRALLAQMTQQQLDAALQGNPGLAQVRDILEQTLKDAFDWDEIRPEFVRMYTELFTEPELRQTIAFYRTAAGQKMLAHQSELMRRGGAIGQRRVQERLPAMQRRIEKRVQQSQ